MPLSFVLRLHPGALAEGRLAGEVEHVATGARTEFRGAADLTRFCTATGAAAADPPLDLPEPRPDSVPSPRTTTSARESR